MKEWIVVKFTGIGTALTNRNVGDVTVWADYTNDGMVYDSPAYEVVARCQKYKDAQAIARSVREAVSRSRTREESYEEYDEVTGSTYIYSTTKI